MSGTLNANYVQADVGTNLYLNTGIASGNVVVGNSSVLVTNTITSNAVTSNTITVPSGSPLTLGAVTIDAGGNTTINSTGFLQIPNGTTAQRPAGANGQFRFNTTTALPEMYNNGTWLPLTLGYTVNYLVVAGGAGGGVNRGGGGGAGGMLTGTTTVTQGIQFAVTVGGAGSGSGSQGTVGGNGNPSSFGTTTVSYTHLTLPTKRIV